MALLDLFKKKKKLELPKESRRLSAEKPKPSAKLKEAKPAREKTQEPEKPVQARPISKVKARGAELAFRVLKAPHVTEKSGDLAQKNQYIFRVFMAANKTEIKQVVEGLYNVDVESVRIIRTMGKKRRTRRITGWRPGYKKAIVKVKEGQTIEVLPR